MVRFNSSFKKVKKIYFFYYYHLVNIMIYCRLAQCVKIMFAIAILISYALQAFVPVDILWSTYVGHKIKRHQLFWEYFCRTLVTLVTCKLFIIIIYIIYKCN